MTDYLERALNRIAPERVEHRLKFAACEERQKYGDLGVRRPRVAGRAGRQSYAVALRRERAIGQGLKRQCPIGWGQHPAAPEVRRGFPARDDIGGEGS